MTCTNCGAVQAENQTSNGAEWRAFGDDQKSKVPGSVSPQLTLSQARTGPSYNPHMEYDLTQHTQRDEKEFLWDGHKNIDTVLSKLFMGEIPQKIRTRAIELFQRGFKVQTAQKKGAQLDKLGVGLPFHVLLSHLSPPGTRSIQAKAPAVQPSQAVRGFLRSPGTARV